MLSGPRLYAAIAVAVAAIGGGAVFLLLPRGPDPGKASEEAGAKVRLQAAQGEAWMVAPPLAAPDPTVVEPSRESAATARPPPPVAARPAAPELPTMRIRPARPEPRAPEASIRAPARSATMPVEPVLPPPAPVAEPPPPPPEPAPEPARVAAQAALAIRPPVLETRNCVEESLRIPRGVDSRLPPAVTIQVAVDPAGRPSDVQFPGAVEPRLASALAAAVRTCTFTPGADGTGRPATLWTTMRIRFAQ